MSSSNVVKDIDTIDLGTRLELFTDYHVVDNVRKLRTVTHSPEAKELVIIFDRPWEGKICAYYTIIRETDQFLRLYYRGADIDLETKKDNGYRTCYAESRDGGVTWEKPNLGLFEYDGSTENNILWVSLKGSENFTPFKDTKPDVPDNQRYKAVGFRMHHYKLYAMISADGIHWNLMRDEPLLTYYHGKFDTQNIAFWNPEINQYMLFYRDYLDKEKNIGRGTKIALSEDFIHWTKFKWLHYNDNLNQKFIQLYTNCIQPYYRAPHMLIGFPNRFNEYRRGYQHPHRGVFDIIFMSSRDGFKWVRTPEAIIRPGPQQRRWVTRNNMIALGMFESPSDLDSDLEKCPPTISILSSEGYYLDQCGLRRYSYRLDGFVSMNATIYGGYLLTKPITFSGRYLRLNLSTSAMGEIKVEIQDAKTKQGIKGYEMGDCIETFGDSVNKIVCWRNNCYDLTELIGRPVRLNFFLRDCDLYSFQFTNE